MNFATILQEFFSVLIGIIFALTGIKALKDEGAQKKVTTVAFWFILAFTFICGQWLVNANLAWVVGAAIVVMACLTAIGGVVQTVPAVHKRGVVGATRAHSLRGFEAHGIG